MCVHLISDSMYVAKMLNHIYPIPNFFFNCWELMSGVLKVKGISATWFPYALRALLYLLITTASELITNVN